MLDVLLVVVIDPSAVTALATVAKFQLVVTLFLRQSILEVPPQLKPVVKSKALGFVNLAFGSSRLHLRLTSHDDRRGRMHQDRTGPLHGSSDTLSEDELLLELEVLPAVNRPSEDMP